MSGILIDFITVVAGSSIGLLFKKSISEKISKAVMIGIGLCVVYMGISGITSDANIIVILLSFVIGSAIGTAFDIDGWLNRVGETLEKRFVRNDGESKLAKGCITMTLLSCTGAYALMAGINAGLGNNEMMLTKAVIDFVVSMMLSSTLGVGVMLSAVPILVFQVILAMLADMLSPILVGDMLTAFSIVGAILTIPLGTSLIGVTNIKIANYIPAIFIAPILAWCATLLPVL